MAVLVMTCDGYSDAWPPFFDLIKKYWPDNPFPVYLSTESLPVSEFSVMPLHSGQGVEWSRRLLMALERIKEPFVFLLLEDYLPKEKVKTPWFHQYLDILEQTKAICYRVFPAPYPDRDFQGIEGTGIVNPGAPYRVTTQATIWNKEDLKKLIDPSENIWQFELEGTKRSVKTDGYYLSVNPKRRPKHPGNNDLAFNYIFTGIIRGRWTREALKLCEREGIKIDTKRRKVKPIWDPWFQKVYIHSPNFIRHFLDFIYARLVPSFVPTLK